MTDRNAPKYALSTPEIDLYRESVDFRKSINGLATILESDINLSLGSGALSCLPINSVIKSKCCSRIKQASPSGINGLKKPNISGLPKRKNQVLTLTQFEFEKLLSGFTVIGHKPVRTNDFTMT
ncbi:hypothetical protein P3674_02695 [Vibrio parahaemolyticus]|nr:hypothetical protein [Vibrio parahaemolyticus]MDF5385846.1 hypothetical protein [Vibrio parahaemolyticus]MDF5447642.1 hypothetical protein [Vibrio parahaemolyticus]